MEYQAQITIKEKNKKQSTHFLSPCASSDEAFKSAMRYAREDKNDAEVLDLEINQFNPEDFQE